MRAHLVSTHRALRATLGGLILGVAFAPACLAQFAGPALSVPSRPAESVIVTTDPALLSPEIQVTQINSGDIILVRIFGVADYVPTARVNSDGFVQLPLIGKVHVGGLSVTKAEDLIAQLLSSAGMYNNPQVSVNVSEASSSFVTVTGEMHATVPVTGERRLLEVLGAAGSLPASASHTVTILRPGVAHPIVVNLGPDPATSAQANIPILPRDVVVISRVGVVYVIGAFKTQGSIPLLQNSPLTLIQVAALSGGAGYEGKYKDLRIIRTEGLERKLVKVDYKRILDGKDPDPVLAADDIVFLPTDLIKAAIKGGGINTLTSLIGFITLTATEFR